MELDDLTRHREVVPLLAEWHVREWQHLYPEWTVEIATTELAAMSPDGIPHTIVALHDGDVIGSASIIADDELPGFAGVGPWLASVYVRPDARRTGAGRRLVAAIVEFARAHGVARLHLFNESTTAYYERLGWRPIATTAMNGHPVTVMTLETHPDAPRRAIVSDWCTSPWFRGAYSYLRANGAPSDRDVLAGPIAPGLVLAGEATSRDFPGTAHGAWFSGERAAAAVADAASVVVVGAGLAGIAAARAAQASGARVTVLEATARVGGRAVADRRLGGPVNLGAAWMHGTDGHPFSPVVGERAASFPRNVWERTATFVAGNGELSEVDLRPLRRKWAEVDARIARAAETAPAGATVADVLEPEIDAVADDALAATVLRCWLRGEYENLYAAPPSDLSLRNGSEPFRLPGDDLLVTVGNDELIAPLADGIDIRVDEPVTAIERRTDGWRVRTAAGEHVADAVIVTVSIGVLKADAIEFDPPLPEHARDALDRIGFGAVTKAFFTFDRAFWAPRRVFWIASDPPQVFELWVDVSELRGGPTLCAFAVGDDARTVEQMSEDDLLSVARSVLVSALSDSRKMS